MMELMSHLDAFEGTESHGSARVSISGLLLAGVVTLLFSVATGAFLLSAKPKPVVDSGPNTRAFRTVLVKVDSDGPLLVITPAAGVYHKPITVTIKTVDEEGTIHYVTEGKDEPNELSAKYGAPITISKSTVLQVVAYDRFGNRSAVYSQSYVINPKALSLPLNIAPEGVIDARGAYTLSFRAPEEGVYRLRLGGTDETTGELLAQGQVKKGANVTLKVTAKQLPARHQDVTLWLLNPKKGKSKRKRRRGKVAPTMERISYQTAFLGVKRGAQRVMPFPMAGSYRQPVTVALSQADDVLYSVGIENQLPGDPSATAPERVTISNSGLLTLCVAGKDGKTNLRYHRYVVHRNAGTIAVPGGETTPLLVGAKGQALIVKFMVNLDAGCAEIKIRLGSDDEDEGETLVEGTVIPGVLAGVKIDRAKFVSGDNLLFLSARAAPLETCDPQRVVNEIIETPKVLEATIIPQLGLKEFDKKEVPVLRTYEEPERLPEAVNTKKVVTAPVKKPLRHIKYVKPKRSKRHSVHDLLRDVPIQRDQRRRHSRLEDIVGLKDGSIYSDSPLGKKGNVFAGSVGLAIQRVMRHPPSLSNQMLKRLRVELMISRIDSEGHVLGYVLYRSSGNRAFDSAAVRAIKQFMPSEGGNRRLPRAPAKIMGYINQNGLLVTIQGNRMTR